MTDDLRGCDAAFVIEQIPTRTWLTLVEGEHAVALALASPRAATLPASLGRLHSRDPAEAAGCTAFRRIPVTYGAHPPLSATLHFRAGEQRLSLAVGLRARESVPRGLLTLNPIGHSLSVRQPCPQIDLSAPPDRSLSDVGVHYLHARVVAAEAGPATVLLYPAGIAGAVVLWVAGTVWG